MNNTNNEEIKLDGINIQLLADYHRSLNNLNTVC